MKTINNKAHNTIILHLSDEVLRKVAKERTASVLWAKLEELFLKKYLAKRFYMKRKLYTFSMKDETTLKDHLDEFNNLILDFENVNIVLKDKDIAMILLSSLLDSYEHFMDTLCLTVKSKLKKRNKEKKNNSQRDKAEKKKKKKKRKCYFYHKEGHYIKECFEKKKLEKIHKELTGKVVVAFEDERDSEGAYVLVHLFKTFESIDGGKVLLGNNLACKVAGIRTKSEALEKFKEWTTLMENQVGRKVKRLRIDNGLKFYSSEFEEFCKKHDIMRHKTMRHTPQQNGLAKRMNRTLIEKLINLQIRSWLEGVSSAEQPKFKARLVAKGFTQKKEVDFKEVFSPVVMHSSIRVLLAITASLDLELDQIDVKTTFLHGNLDEEIFMSQPEGFIKEGIKGKVCLLKKSLYACKLREEIEKLNDELSSEFGMKNLDYARKVLDIFGMLSFKPVFIPLAAHIKLSKQQEPTKEADVEYMMRIPYSSATGSIMYAMVCTRHDAAFGIGVVSKVLGYVDSDFAGDLDKRRLVTGFVFILFGGVVSWKASLQSVVALLTTEAEYIALIEAVKEAKWLRGLVSELGLREEISTGVVDVVKISSEINPADMLTKPLPAIKFINSLNLIRVVSL
ncbi:Integrase catalytic domain-containing protein [Citrus sinensis]|uniref:Integrase catalytic domain-containing protein n=1 Tax=Citrus sinensis TaxID=2711 RepID=A0ACB8IKL7_CITSI|nr:Integrase catalytic domain-containing protein [Citrus sinensis]